MNTLNIAFVYERRNKQPSDAYTVHYCANACHGESKVLHTEIFIMCHHAYKPF